MHLATRDDSGQRAGGVVAPWDVVTFDLPELVDALRSSFFERCGLRVTVATTARALLAAARRLNPHVIIAPTGRLEVPVIHALRDTLAPHGRLLLAADRGALPTVEDLKRYDGLVPIASAELDLMRLLAPLLAPLPGRDARMRVSIPVWLFAGGPDPHLGNAINLSRRGACVTLPELPAWTFPLSVYLYRSDGRSVTLVATVEWTDRRGDAPRMGLLFDEMTDGERRKLRDVALWHIVDEQGTAVVHLQGDIDASSDLTPVAERVAGGAAVDVGEIGGVDAGGLLRWWEMIRALPDDVLVRLRRVPIPLGRRFASLPGMLGRCRVESLFAALSCRTCPVRLVALIEPVPEALPPCDRCGVPLSPAVGGVWPALP